MKKVLVLAAMAVFSSLYTNVWGDTDYSRDGITATYSGTVLTISAGSTGVMPNYTYNSAKVSEKAPWDAAMSSITEVRINEGITYIGKDAFRGATSLSKVTIPVSLDSVGNNAFNGCTNVANLYYKGLPSQWASIGFYAQYSHPFGASSGVTRKHYFYGITSSAPSVIFIEPGISTIKKWTFFHGSYESICIPGTVSSIGTHAFDCTISTSLIINRSAAPTLGSSAILSVSRTLYIPSSNSGYNVSPWTSYSISTCKTSATSTIDGNTLSWNLNTDGVLTINATSGSKALTFNLAGDDHPWGMFRRMVYKVKIQGDLTALGNLLRYHYGISEVIVDQTKIPTISSTYIGGTSYASLFNKRDKLTLSVKPASLLDASVSNLKATPWSDDTHWQIGLAETATFYERAENTDTLEAIKTYIDLPFSLQLKRTLSNAYYNTFCSPIPISAEQIVSTWGDDTYAHEFEGTEYDEEKDSLTLHFTEEIASIAAGVPYLIQPENNVANPTFTNVVPSTIVTEPATITPDDAAASFVGTILSENVTEEWAEAENFIFLKADNKLTFATTGTLRGMRAYFLLDKDVSASALAKAPGLRIGHSEHIATATEHLPHDAAHNASKIIRNGQLVIVRDGAEYNAQGIRIN